MKTLRDINCAGETVLLRIDANVPLDDKGQISDDYKIKEVLPTINLLINQGAKVVILSSLGRPDSKVVEKLRLRVVAKHLQRLLGQPVLALPAVRGQKTVIANAREKLIMLENLRFCAEEESNDEGFARELASYGDLYINDAFANSHREHASMVGIPKYLPAYAGLLVEKEVGALSRVVENPARPLLAILGGAKLETKIKLVEALAAKADGVCVGGKLANTFLKAQGINLGGDQIEGALVQAAKTLLEKTADAKVILPVDVMTQGDESAKPKAVAEIVAGDAVYDIGEKSINSFSAAIDRAKTIIWNGAMGYFENELYAAGTFALARKLASCRAFTVAGGGETVEVIDKLGLTAKFGHVSTGGGAMLEYLEKGTLPALAVL